MENSKIFRIICHLFTFLLLALLSSPLITLAFYSTNQPAVIDQTSGEPAIRETVDYAFILNEDYSNTPPSNKPVFDNLTVAERHQRHLPTRLPNYQPYYGKKTVYLTFDDGPDPENTPIVLDILKKSEIKATFFITGRQAEKYPDLVMRIYQEGHAIGNHSYNHVYRELYQSPYTYVEQLHKTDEIIKNITGVRPHITRAPGGTVGSFTKDYWELIKEEGYVEVGWNVSSGDASQAHANDIYQNIAYQLDNSFLLSHAIVLMHDGRGHSETLKALPNIISYFKNHSFEFRVITLDTPPPW